MLPNWLGGKTYFFVNYEARRFPQATTYRAHGSRSAVAASGRHSGAQRAGVYQAYNLNPVSGHGEWHHLPAGRLPGRRVRPARHRPESDRKQSLELPCPLPNDPQFGDSYNTQGYNSNVSIPQTSDNYVIRMDHDFGAEVALDDQLPLLQVSAEHHEPDGYRRAAGRHVGQPSCHRAARPEAGVFVTGLTTTITPTLTNDFHYNYLRNFWQWGTDGAPPQVAGLGGALEIGGETASTNALIPYNVNSQSVRQRFWDGQDHAFRDD